MDVFYSSRGFGMSKVKNGSEENENVASHERSAEVKYSFYMSSNIYKTIIVSNMLKSLLQHSNLFIHATYIKEKHCVKLVHRS